jgi:chaperonin GroEL
LTTQCMIADKPEEKGAGGMPPMPPGGGYPGMM